MLQRKREIIGLSVVTPDVGMEQKASPALPGTAPAPAAPGLAPAAPKAPGLNRNRNLLFADVGVDDNTKVRAGDVIVRIDDGDYRLAVDSARDKVNTQQATVERFERQIVAQQAAVKQTRAQLVSAQAAQVRAQAEYERQQAL